jgi:hypothetical protein
VLAGRPASLRLSGLKELDSNEDAEPVSLSFVPGCCLRQVLFRRRLMRSKLFGILSMKKGASVLR